MAKLNKVTKSYFDYLNRDHHQRERDNADLTSFRNTFKPYQSIKDAGISVSNPVTIPLARTSMMIKDILTFIKNLGEFCVTLCKGNMKDAFLGKMTTYADFTEGREGGLFANTGSFLLNLFVEAGQMLLRTLAAVVSLATRPLLTAGKGVVKGLSFFQCTNDSSDSAENHTNYMDNEEAAYSPEVSL
jgi:hypothetical protein